MSEFFSTVSPSLWSSISVVVWLAVFVGVTCLVYRPSVRGRFEDYGKLPLNKD